MLIKSPKSVQNEFDSVLNYEAFACFAEFLRFHNRFQRFDRICYRSTEICKGHSKPRPWESHPNTWTNCWLSKQNEINEIGQLFPEHFCIRIVFNREILFSPSFLISCAPNEHFSFCFTGWIFLWNLPILITIFLR